MYGYHIGLPAFIHSANWNLRSLAPEVTDPAMIVQELRARLRAKPFQPFVVVTADGGQIRVHHHDYAWLLSMGGELYIEDEQGRVHHVYTDHITRLVYEQSQPGQAAGAFPQN